MNQEREELEARIAAYVDGELPAAEAARLEVFLANTDPRLAEQVIGMLSDKHRMTSLPKPGAPEDLAGRIMEQVERASLLNNVDQLTTHHRPWWQSRAAVAAALFLFGGALTYFILQALHPANPAWQAALEPPTTHLPTVASAQPKASTSAIMAAPSGGIAAAGGESSNRLDDATPLAAAPIGAGGPPAPGSASAPPTNQVASAAKDLRSADQLLNVTPPATLAPAGLFAAGLMKDSIAAKTEPSPVVLSLVADTPGDFARLHSALDLLLAQNTSNSSRASQQLSQDSQKSEATDAAANSNLAANQSMKESNNQASNSSQTANSMGIGQQQNNALATATGRMEGNTFSRAGGQGGGGGAGGGGGRGGRFAGPTTYPASYHLALKRSDIEQLTRQFHVQSPLARRDLSLGTTPTTIADKAGDRANYKYGVADAPVVTETPAVPAAQALDAVDKDFASADTPVDCVITMTPAVPAPTAVPDATAAPATRPDAAH